jgi:hypothetical protein
MDPREPFSTDEFYRYCAECRRLARLAHNSPPPPPVKSLARSYQLFADWLGALRQQYQSPRLAAPQWAPASRARRR